MLRGVSGSVSTSWDPALDTSRVSPTAHYTGYVWFRNGLSHPALVSQTGKLSFRLLQPGMLAGSLLAGGTFEAYLVQRHRAIDALLSRAIESGRVRQVVEVAGGLSARGVRFAERYQRVGLQYIEGDLPGMARRKQRALDRASLSRDNHHVVALNALIDTGPGSLEHEILPRLDPGAGTVLVTEGLLSYFDLCAVQGMWGRFNRFLSTFPHGVYLSDFYLGSEWYGVRVGRALEVFLKRVARGRIHVHFDTEPEGLGAVREAGFAGARLFMPRELRAIAEIPTTRRNVVRVLEART